MIEPYLRAESPPWLPIAVSVAYFLVWLAQKVFQGAAQRTKTARRASEDEGTVLWKDLLEGKVPAEPRQAARTPGRVETPRPPQPAASTAAPPTPKPARKTARRRGTAREPRRRRPEPRTPVEPRVEVPEPLPPEPVPRFPEPAPRPLRASLPEGSVPDAPTAPPSSAGRAAFDLPENPSDWRRAMVLREVLGPPVALRRGAGPGDLGPY